MPSADLPDTLKLDLLSKYEGISDYFAKALVDRNYSYPLDNLFMVSPIASIAYGHIRDLELVIRILWPDGDYVHGDFSYDRI